MPATYLVSIVILGLTVVPMLYVILDGFRTTAQIERQLDRRCRTRGSGRTTARSSPARRSGEFLGNSALIAAVATALAVGLGSMAAFALSRYVFRGREACSLLFISGLLFPLQTRRAAAVPAAAADRACWTTCSAWRCQRRRSRCRSRSSSCARSCAAIPGDLEDAAMVDGATRLRFFARILLPMCKPALITVAMLGVRHELEPFLLPLLVFSTPVALHPAARRRHVPVDVLVEHGLGPGVHRAGRGARPRRVPVGPALPGGRCVRRGQGVGLFPVRKNCSRDERNGVSDDSGSVRAVEGRQVFVRDLDGGVAGRRRVRRRGAPADARPTGRSASLRSWAPTA